MSTSLSSQELEDVILAHIIGRFERGERTLKNLHQELVEKFPQRKHKNANDTKRKKSVRIEWIKTKKDK